MDDPKLVAIVVTLSASVVLCILFISYRCLGFRQPNQPASDIESGSQWSLGPGGSSRDDVPLQGKMASNLENAGACGRRSTSSQLPLDQIDSNHYTRPHNLQAGPSLSQKERRKQQSERNGLQVLVLGTNETVQ